MLLLNVFVLESMLTFTKRLFFPKGIVVVRVVVAVVAVVASVLEDVVTSTQRATYSRLWNAATQSKRPGRGG